MRRRNVDRVKPPKGDGEVWFDFIAGQVTAEHDRRASLDARGATIVTASGVFFTAVFALGAFVLGKDYQPDGLTTVFTAVALGAFILAALTALRATAFRDYDVADVRSLRLMTGDAHWWATPAAARQDLAAVNVATVDTLRGGNEKKAARLTWAASFQLIAMMALGAALLVAVVRHDPSPTPASPQGVGKVAFSGGGLR